MGRESWFGRPTSSPGVAWARWLRVVRRGYSAIPCGWCVLEVRETRTSAHHGVRRSRLPRQRHAAQSVWTDGLLYRLLTSGHEDAEPARAAGCDNAPLIFDVFYTMPRSAISRMSV